jgi:two-component system chemotaxis sensor kinase CheA
MSDRDVIELVFKPGFSTSAEVTNLSGRGVGMDAVRTAVESIGGRVMVASETGHGSTVSFVLPFSVMMTRLMTVEAAGQMFGIPLDAVAETVHVPREKIKAIGTAFAFVLRNQTIPMLDLAHALGRPRAAPTSSEAVAVITSIGGQWSALEVDRVGERLEAILRPIDGLLSGMTGISGTTLLGNGQVLLVLDLQELLADTGLSEARQVP